MDKVPKRSRNEIAVTSCYIPSGPLQQTLFMLQNELRQFDYTENEQPPMHYLFLIQNTFMLNISDTDRFVKHEGSLNFQKMHTLLLFLQFHCDYTPSRIALRLLSDRSDNRRKATADEKPRKPKKQRHYSFYSDSSNIAAEKCKLRFV